jgi:hypothetical protein
VTVSGQTAVLAWAGLPSPRALMRPTAAVTVKPPGGGSAVYRLVGAGAGGGDVIAKWAHRAALELESRLYMEVLPGLPVATVSCYGLVRDDDDATAWLFLDDAGGVPYAPDRPEHRRLAARWLAAMHGAAARRPPPSALPMRDATYYRTVLERACRMIVSGFSNPALASEHLENLRSVLRRFETLLDHWPEVERLSAAMPPTLVHADLVAKNMRVREGTNGATLVALDWEAAGWGSPGIDLQSVDVDEYAREIRSAWPTLVCTDIVTSAHVGQLFWFAACVDWESWALETEWVWRLMKNLPVYERRVSAVLAELGWM